MLCFVQSGGCCVRMVPACFDLFNCKVRTSHGSGPPDWTSSELPASHGGAFSFECIGKYLGRLGFIGVSGALVTSERQTPFALEAVRHGRPKGWLRGGR